MTNKSGASRLTRIPQIFLCFIFLTGSTIFSGCILPGSTEPPQELTHTEWSLASYRDAGGNQVQPLPGSVITLTFNHPGEFTGRSGCNSYQGSYTVEGELITIQSLTSTEMFCSEPQGVMAQEEYYLSLLSNVTRYHVADEYLILSYYDVGKLMVFEIKG